jgi:predicted negative regulator of RcsB-dependent stress response
MARHPAARRVHRTAEAPDDAFVAGVLETSAWAKQHSRTLILGGLLVALLVGGFIWYRVQRSATREAASTELSQVRQSALMGNYALAVRDLEAFLQRFDGTPAAGEARVLLAQSYLELEQPQQAIDTAERLARNPGEPLGATAAFLMATAQESTGQLAEAEATYLRVADRARFLFQRLEALDHAARLRIEQGDAAGAAELYERAMQEIPIDRVQDRSVFEMRRAEALALARGAAPAAAPEPTAAPPEGV